MVAAGGQYSGRGGDGTTGDRLSGLLLAEFHVGGWCACGRGAPDRGCGGIVGQPLGLPRVALLLAARMLLLS